MSIYNPVTDDYEHDKFCPLVEDECPGYPEDPKPYDGHREDSDRDGDVCCRRCGTYCTCANAARIRADEREKTAQQVEAITALLLELVEEHASTVDWEFGCCHDKDDVNGNNYRGHANDYCDYLKIVTGWTARLAAARGEDGAA